MRSWPRGNGDTSRKTVKQDKPDWPSSKLIKVVNVSDLPNLETSLKVEKCEYLASYNWLNYLKYPTILVPNIDFLPGSDCKKEN
jgi:hypothetical protein